MKSLTYDFCGPSRLMSKVLAEHVLAASASISVDWQILIDIALGIYKRRFCPTNRMNFVWHPLHFL